MFCMENGLRIFMTKIVSYRDIILYFFLNWKHEGNIRLWFIQPCQQVIMIDKYDPRQWIIIVDKYGPCQWI